jgi:hypothetical protein
VADIPRESLRSVHVLSPETSPYAPEGDDVVDVFGLIFRPPSCYAMACTPFTNTRSQIGVLRFIGSHLASISFKITTAESSDTVVAGTRRRMDDCERPTVRARRVNWSSGTGPLRRDVGTSVADGRSPSSLRLGERRAIVSVDLYNAMNGDTVLSYKETYIPDGRCLTRPRC